MKVGIEMNEKWICAILNESEIKSLTSHWKGKIELKTNFKETNSKDKIWTYRGRLIFVEITFFCLANPD